MKNTKLTKKPPYLLITLLIMAVIFIHSAMPADLSSQESFLFSRILVVLFRFDDMTASFIVRKCAHFLEYTVLGVSLFFTVSDYLRQNCPKRMMGNEYKTWKEDEHADRTSIKKPEKEMKGKPAGILSDPYRRAAQYMKLTIWISWLTGTLYALSDEFHQRFVPGRSCSLRDVLIDSAGCLSGILITVILKSRKQSKKSDLQR